MDVGSNGFVWVHGICVMDPGARWSELVIWLPGGVEGQPS